MVVLSIPTALYEIGFMPFITLTHLIRSNNTSTKVNTYQEKF
jgi:hypothetical protein